MFSNFRRIRTLDTVGRRLSLNLRYRYPFDFEQVTFLHFVALSRQLLQFLRFRGVYVPQVRMLGPYYQDRTSTILTLNAYVNEIQAGDFGQAEVEPADGVAGADYQAADDDSNHNQ